MRINEIRQTKNSQTDEVLTQVFVGGLGVRENGNIGLTQVSILLNGIVIPEQARAGLVGTEIEGAILAHVPRATPQPFIGRDGVERMSTHQWQLKVVDAEAFQRSFNGVLAAAVPASQPVAQKAGRKATA